MDKRKGWKQFSPEESGGLFGIEESDLAGYAAEPRLSECTLLVYCTNGKASLHIGLESYDITGGDAFFLFPYKLLMLRDATPDFRVVCFFFCREILDEVVTGLPTALILYIRHHPKVELNHTDLSFIRAMTTQLKRVRDDNNQLYKSKIAANILSNFLLIHYGSQHVLGEASQSLYHRSEELFKRFLTDIETCCGESHNVTDYAARLCITSKYLTDITRSKTGKSPKEMIDETLLRRMECSLKNSMKSVKEISIEGGFPTPAYFARFFRRMTGMTPQAYRAKVSR